MCDVRNEFFEVLTQGSVAHIPISRNGRSALAFDAQFAVGCVYDKMGPACQGKSLKIPTRIVAWLCTDFQQKGWK